MKTEFMEACRLLNLEEIQKTHRRHMLTSVRQLFFVGLHDAFERLPDLQSIQFVLAHRSLLKSLQANSTLDLPSLEKAQLQKKLDQALLPMRKSLGASMDVFDDLKRFFRNQDMVFNRPLFETSMDQLLSPSLNNLIQSEADALMAEGMAAAMTAALPQTASASPRHRL